MKNLTVDVAVIGAGTAGLAAYRAARARGARAVIVESGPYGTTCARVGCMPSKLLIAAAEASHAIDEAPGFGVHVEGAKRVDGREVMDRVKRERDRFVGFVVEGVERIPASDRIAGRARFLDRHTLEVDGHTRVSARAIVIATGSRPVIPSILDGAGDRLLVNDDVFAWDTLPRSVAVFGPGVIGLELGQALSRLGVRVVVLGRGGRVGPLADPVVRDAFLKSISAELYVDPDAHVRRVARITDGVEVEYTRLDGTLRTESFDYALAATGRRPNVDGLGLESLGLELDAAGVPRFDPRTLRAGDSNLFIAGDASNFIPLLHEAADEGRIAGDNAARLPDAQPGKRRTPLAVVFTDPQIAIVGEGFAKLVAGTFEAGEVSFEDQGRSRVMRRNRGHLRVYADRASGRFLGAEMAGPAAEHIGHLLAWAAANRMTVASMLEMPFYHPVVEEGLRTALRDLDAKLRTPQAIAA
ncbi:MAG: dihydrolipoyl dehydrogenase [Betaproteobacteria bacterium]|nr:dihydrolipoyl dehydrogenase [Betaproteobacteria bacterium]